VADRTALIYFVLKQNKCYTNNYLSCY